MSKPPTSGARMKRLARHLLAYPSSVWKFTGDVELSQFLDVFSDSDWAGDRRSRNPRVDWSSTQGSVALSVGEAEYSALVKGAAEGIAHSGTGARPWN